MIITYYWPPSGGSGVQRWLKFVKYLPEFGWKPYVFTPESPALVQRDESLLKDVSPDAEIIQIPIWEPYDLFFKLTGAKKGDQQVKPSQLSLQKKKTVVQKLTSWVRGNFFIPDPKIFWVRPAVKFLHAYLKEHDIRNIVTTGPPHSMHLIGLKLKKKNSSLNWIADFRDPWSEWPFLEAFNMTGAVKKRHSKLEREVITTADHVITITPYYVQRFEELSGRSVAFIPNGFDDDDFKTLKLQRPDKFTIRHIGIVYDRANSLPLIKALSQLMTSLPDFAAQTCVEFVGEVNATFRQSLTQSTIGELVSFKDPVPHKDLIAIYGNTSMLLLNIAGYKHAEGLMPGKLFEYLATGLPILGIGPVGNAAAVLENSNSGKMFQEDDVDGMVSLIKDTYVKWKNSEQFVGKHAEKQSNYSRRHLTGHLISLLNS